MQTDMTIVGPSLAQIILVIPAGEADEALRLIIKKLNPKTTVKGFRPGHAPDSAVLKQAHVQVLAELYDTVIGKALEDAAKDSGLTPLEPPLPLGLPDLKLGQPVSCVATFEFAPELTWPDLSSIELQSAFDSAAEVPESQILARLERLRQELATGEDLLDEPAAPGNRVTVSLKAPQDSGIISFGVIVTPGRGQGPESGEEPGRCVVIAGESGIFPALSQAVVGRKRGEILELPNPAWPMAIISPDMAGRDLVAQAEILKIERLELPPLDDDLAASADPDLESLEDLKRIVRERLAEDRESWARADLEERIRERLAALVDYEPSEKEIRSAIELSDRMAPPTRGNPEESPDAPDRSLWESHLPQAIRDAKANAVFARIAWDEGIEAPPEELESELEAIVRHHDGRPDDSLVEFWRRQIGNQIKRDLVIERIIEAAKVTEIPFEEASAASSRPFDPNRVANDAS
jgi:trigger factor